MAPDLDAAWLTHGGLWRLRCVALRCAAPSPSQQFPNFPLALKRSIARTSIPAPGSGCGAAGGHHWLPCLTLVAPIRPRPQASSSSRARLGDEVQGCRMQSLDLRGRPLHPPGEPLKHEVLVDDEPGAAHCPRRPAPDQSRLVQVYVPLVFPNAQSACCPAAPAVCCTPILSRLVA